MDQDRRAHRRFPLVLAVQYFGADAVLGYTENLSAGGLFIRTEREFQVGERVPLVLTVPQLLEPVELEVEIVRRRGGGPEAPAGVAVVVPVELAADRARLLEVARRIAAMREPEPGFRVLLVEDNALVASMYSAALRRLSDTDRVTGLGIELASSGEEAFARLVREPRVDLLVTDLFMPGMSGIDLVERIRAEPSLSSTPIVVISAGGEKEREQLARLGISVFLQNPVKYQDLVASVRDVFQRKERATEGVPVGEHLGHALTPAEPVPRSTADAIPASRR